MNFVLVRWGNYARVGSRELSRPGFYPDCEHRTASTVFPEEYLYKVRPGFAHIDIENVDVEWAAEAAALYRKENPAEVHPCPCQMTGLPYIRWKEGFPRP